MQYIRGEPRAVSCGYDRYLKNYDFTTPAYRLFTDATVTVAGQDFQVHKHVLADASPVFERMFSSDMLEGKLGLPSTSCTATCCSGSCVNSLGHVVSTSK